MGHSHSGTVGLIKDKNDSVSISFNNSVGLSVTSGFTSNGEQHEVLDVEIQVSNAIFKGISVHLSAHGLFDRAYVHDISPDPLVDVAKVFSLLVGEIEVISVTTWNKYTLVIEKLTS